MTATIRVACWFEMSPSPPRPSKAAKAAAEPVPAGQRMLVLDVIRGAALFGILMVNLPQMGLPGAFSFAPAESEAFPAELAWALPRVLFETKFVALFSFLFGVGLALQIGRARDRGRDPIPLLKRRLLALAGIGVLHALLLFEGDILLPYAVAGGCFLFARNLAPRKLIVLGAAFFVIGLGFAFAAATYESLSGEAWVTPTRPAAPLVQDTSGDYSWRDLLADDPVRSEQANWHGTLSESWLAQAPYRVTQWIGWLVVSSITPFNWNILALVFVGAAAFRLRFFEEHPSLHTGLFWGGLASGLVSQMLVVALPLWFGFEPGRDVYARTILDVFGSLALAVGYVAGLILFVRSGALGWLARGLAAAGRMSLSNYLGQSLLAAILFEGWAFGAYGSVPRIAFPLITALIFAVQVVVSSLWLRRFPQGPAEWAWRRITYRR